MTLSNDILAIEVAEHGAEMVSLRKHGREHLWTGDAAFWNRHAPILFPAVGKPFNNELHCDGSTWPMKQHGYARDSGFERVDTPNDKGGRADASLTLALPRADADAIRQSGVYPFCLGLEVCYRLIGSCVEALWTVTNHDARDAYFQIGAHPGFLLPGFSAADAVHGYIRLLGRDGQPVQPLVRSALAEGNRMPLAEPQRMQSLLALTDDTFAHDALMFEEGQVACAELCDKEKRPVLRVGCPQADAYGIWAPHKEGCPFVCLEPWCGICDPLGFTGDIAHRQYIHRLGPAQQYTFAYTIELLAD